MSVLQLVKLLQAEFESAALGVENSNSDRRKAALLQAPNPTVPNPPPPPKGSSAKAPLTSPLEGGLKAMEPGG